MKLKKIIERNFMLLPHQPNKKMKMFQCKYCTTIYAQHTTRMSTHLVNCKGCPESIKQQIEQNLNSKNESSSNNSIQQLKKRQRESSGTEASHNTSNENLKLEIENIEIQKDSQPAYASEINHFLDFISKRDQIRAEELVAKAIYSSGSPLSIVENAEWIATFSFLRPSFKVPTRHDIANRLLNFTYENVKEQVNQKIRNADILAIQSDGFSNIRNEGIVNIIITTPDPVLYRSIDASNESQNAEYIAKLLSKAIDDVGPEKVLSVCTDNASACKKAWRIIEEQYKNHFITCYGCVAHILHLFVKDLLNLPSVNTVMKNATEISKEIKYSHILESNLASIQKTPENTVNISLKIPGKTRWGSSLNCLESLSQNEQNLKLLTIRDLKKKLKPESKQLILSDHFWMQIKELISLIKPINVWLQRVQSDDSRINQITELFIDLENQYKKMFENCLSLLSFTDSTKLLTSLEERKNMTIQPIHFAANILDPAFKGKNLSQEAFSDGSELIIKLSDKFGFDKNEVMLELMEYNGETSIYGKDFVKVSSTLVKPIDWWKGAFKSSSLSKIAVTILSLPCTSAATERSFNTYSWIHNSKRNRLGNERAGKIVYISHNVKLLNRKKKLLKNNSSVSESESDSEEKEKSDETENVSLI